MKVASAISAFKEKWESVAGTGSELERSMSPELRKFRCAISGMSVAVVEEILGEISAVGAETQMLKPASGSCMKAREVIILSASSGLSATVACCLCNLCGVHWFGTLLMSSLLTAVMVFVVGRRMSKEIADKEVLCTSNGMCEVSVSEESVLKAVDKSYEGLSEVVSCVKRIQEEGSMGYDISDSRQFGEWVQKFVDYCNDSQENSDLRILKGELLTKLRMVGIDVYDTIRKDGAGNVILPVSGGFRDERITSECAYSVVRHAVVSSNRRVLAIGELA